jgi:soluble lytic murein transglycosylase
MQARFKAALGALIAGALAGVLMGVPPALAQTKAHKSHAVRKPVAAKSRASAASKHRKHTAKPAAAKARPASAPAPEISIQTIPAHRLRPEEARQKAVYDAAIAATRDRAVSSDDAARIRDAIAAIADGGFSKGKALRDRIADPAGRKLVDWYLYRNGYGSAVEIRAFVVANPTWPDKGQLTQRAEENLFDSDASPAQVKAFFAETPPATAVGMAALAAALAAGNDAAAAKALAAKLWVEYDIPAAYEAQIFKRMGSLLTEADHKRRLDRLLLDDVRWAAERKERAAIVRRVIAHLSESEKKKAEARLAVFLRAKNSSQLMARLPADAVAKEWGLAFQRAQLLRRQDKDELAWKILLSEPEPTLAVRPDGWWEERRAAAYAALRADKPRTAYALVRDPGPLLVNAHNDSCFMAGWIALRYLDNPKQALVHFQALAQSADGPLSRSRAHYWLGRTYEALGDRGTANEHYLKASLQVDTFHGQLARLKLDPQASALKIDPPAEPTREEIARFNGLDAVQAAIIARKAGVDASIVRAFLIQLRTHMKTEAEVAMLAHLAEALGDTQIAVRIGKYGDAQGFNLIYYAYPVHRLPAYTPLRRPPEPAFILAIARQESEFDTSTLSGAGARGILQVMPVTARHVCHDYKLKCDIPRLMKDPAYNTMMGSAYISDRMEEFRGSYVLTIAGYNAGPGRAREWIREFGDPRDPDVDPIDWIFRIPIRETREYVQKVLSNLQIYRARLGEGATALRLGADLRRAVAARTSKSTAAAADE